MIDDNGSDCGGMPGDVADLSRLIRNRFLSPTMR